MSDKPLIQKLAVREGKKLLLVNSPRGYKRTLGELPKGVRLLPAPTEPADIIQVFVNDQEELEAHLPKLQAALAPDGFIWVSYHKGTSGVPTDINRDTIRNYASVLGLQAVSQIAIDDDWSALRLKRAD